MTDKRKECGCHENCTTLEHECEKPCAWPSCLTPEENAQLLAEVTMEVFGYSPIQGPLIQCAVCDYCCLWSDQFEFHEIWPNAWKWVCLSDVQGTELNYGK